MVKKINHIAIIVEDIEKALIPYKEGLGLTSTEIEFVESYNVRVVFLPIGDTQIELVQPLGSEGELIDFLRTQGGGLHHIALEVDENEIENTIQKLDHSGVPMKDKTPRPGANNSTVAFAEREGFNGVIIELVQPAKA
jgi:methylmalonyl-CoA/ethylmalonyl-CoA epimerase